MKKWLIGVVLGMGIIGASVYDQTYILKDCIVVEVSNHRALINDHNGNLWEVYDVNLHECQIVDLVMNNNGTKIIKDDIVKRIK